MISRRCLSLSFSCAEGGGGQAWVLYQYPLPRLVPPLDPLPCPTPLLRPSYGYLSVNRQDWLAWLNGQSGKKARRRRHPFGSHTPSASPSRTQWASSCSHIAMRGWSYMGPCRDPVEWTRCSIWSTRGESSCGRTNQGGASELGIGFGLVLQNVGEEKGTMISFLAINIDGTVRLFHIMSTPFVRRHWFRPWSYPDVVVSGILHFLIYMLIVRGQAFLAGYWDRDSGATSPTYRPSARSPGQMPWRDISTAYGPLSTYTVLSCCRGRVP